ncbi:MAG: hypothetical protein WKF37_03795 [Bryobacteraceae bacterium]
MRILTVICACVVAGAATLDATTLEKMSVEQMTEKSALIVRGRILSCAGEPHGSVIYTRCKASAIGRWKGNSGTQFDFLVPGSSFGGNTQTFTGAPAFRVGDEHVLFLWVGRKGIPRVVGLSQGSFGLKVDAKGQSMVRREASTERVLNAQGVEIRDESLEMSVSDLREQVRRCLGTRSNAETSKRDRSLVSHRCCQLRLLSFHSLHPPFPFPGVPERFDLNAFPVERSPTSFPIRAVSN